LGSFDPSRLFIYYNERALENDTDNNAPAYLRDGIKSIATNGICSEQAWPYNELMYAQMPPDPCFQSAQAYKTLTYYSLDNGNLDELKTCLAAGFPFVFGFSLYPSFHNADTNGGIVPMPGDESLLGGHAVLAVGYNDATASFIVQNSWGPTVTSNWFEQQIATNQTIAGQFSSLGFTSVTVAGAGSTRLAKGCGWARTPPCRSIRISATSLS
jgi:C1A family cysteine protease